MQIKNWKLVSCSFLALLGCDVEEVGFEAQSVSIDESSASVTPTAPTAVTNNKAVTQNYCDHADRVLRAEALKSQLEVDGDLAKDRERVLLDDLRAGEAVFAGAERLALRGADEVHVGFENGWLVATAPGADAPLAKLRLADGVKVNLFAHDVRKLVISESIAKADIGHLIVMTDIDGAVHVDIEGIPATCLVIDGGGDAAVGPLQVNGSNGVFTDGPKPTKATLHGTSGADTLTGTAINDWIYGYAGGDYIWGGAGGDSLYGNEDSDRIYGESDYSNQGNVLYGGKGDDRLDGGSTYATCYGDDGTDTCFGCWYRFTCP